MFIADLFVGVIEAVAGVVQMIAESLGFAAGRLSKKPKVGERRFSVRRVTVAFLPLMAVVTLIGGLFLYWHWQEGRRAAAIELTKTRITDLARELAARRDADGQLERVAQEEIEAVDAWDQPLLVTYEQTAFQDVVKVRSIGRDGKPDTLDDIKTTHGVIRAKDLGRAALEKAGKAVVDRLLRDDK